MQTSKRAGPGQAGSSHRHVHVNLTPRRKGQGGLEYRPPWPSLPCVPGAVGAEAMRMRQCRRPAAARRHLTALGIATDLAMLDEHYLFAGARVLVYLVASLPNVLLLVLVLSLLT